jgi:D-threo-aldose 1-dehydrogenase
VRPYRPITLQLAVIYQPLTPEEFKRAVVTEVFPALVDLRERGRVKAVGFGTNRLDLAIDLIKEVEFDCILLPGRYTLLEQGVAEELFPLCAAKGIGVLY